MRVMMVVAMMHMRQHAEQKIREKIMAQVNKFFTLTP